jgi:hypothetical protein
VIDTVRSLVHVKVACEGAVRRVCDLDLTGRELQIRLTWPIASAIRNNAILFYNERAG